MLVLPRKSYHSGEIFKFSFLICFIQMLVLPQKSWWPDKPSRWSIWLTIYTDVRLLSSKYLFINRGVKAKKGLSTSLLIFT